MDTKETNVVLAEAQPVKTPQQLYAEKLKKDREEDMAKRAVYGGKYLLPFFIYSIISTFFMYDNFKGILVPAEVILTLVIIGFMLKEKGKNYKAKSVPIIITLLALGVSSTLTTSTVVFWNHAVSFCLLILLLLENFCETSLWEFANYVKEFFATLGKCVERMMDVFTDTVAYAKSPDKKQATTKTYIGIGILICIPILLIVLGLLSSADAVFNNVLQSILPEEITAEFVIGVVCFFVATYMASYTGMKYFFERTGDKPIKVMEQKEALIGITVLIPILLVYAIFCGIQVYYLFLGNGTLPEDYTYAKYAREGFFQLLTVVVINLLMILLFQWLLKESRVLKVLMILVSVATYVMTASSAYRMMLYVKSYNFTTTRYAVLWALALIAVFLFGMILKICFKKFPLFKFGLYLFCVWFTCLSFSRPDYQVVKYNLNNSSAEKELDTYYLRDEISSDAAPLIAEYEKEHDSENVHDWVQNYQVQINLLDYEYNWDEDYNYCSEEYVPTKAPSFRKFNFSDYFARKAFGL